MRVLKFYADWCQPCKMLSQRMEDWDITVPVEEVNIDENTEAAITYGIRSVPTLVILDGDNNVVSRRSGVISQQEFNALVGQ